MKERFFYKKPKQRVSTNEPIYIEIDGLKKEKLK